MTLGKVKINLSSQAKTALLIVLINVVILSIVALFRYAVYDEKLYLHETVMISELLKQGKWIASYGVGLHGFLFKLPVALAFLITGPSVYVATLFHIILASSASGIFYLIVSRFIKLGKWSIVALGLLLLNYQFLSWSLTYHREIPVVFAFLLFLYFLLRDNKGFLLKGFLLMLVLDAKEYVFFTLLPALFIYEVIVNFEEIKHFFANWFQLLKKAAFLLSPSVIYLYLMFFTSAIPVNMFNASILGLTDSHFSYQFQQALPESGLSDGTTNKNTNFSYTVSKKIEDLIEQKIDKKEEAKNSSESSSLSVNNNEEECETGSLRALVLFIGYIEKFFYTSIFSIQGIPLVVLVPSLIASIYLFINWFKERKGLLFLNLFYWSYLVLYIVRVSHHRYLLPIIPIGIIFFLLFLDEYLKQKKDFKVYIIVTMSLLIIVSFISVFYQDLGDSKGLFNILLTFLVTGLFGGLFYFKKYKELFIKLILGTLIGALIFINSYALLTKNQIYKSLTWGANGEADKIAKMVDPKDIVFIDCESGTISEVTYLLNVYRGTNYLPIEWHWKLDKNKINRSLDAVEPTTDLWYGIDMSNLRNFKSTIKQKKITKIILLESQVEGQKFPLEEYIDDLKKEKWLSLERVEQLKNKKVYVFEVKI
ncbi:MAG: hypothetical protein UT34_C0002G0258 [candidate division WS6 bacterium GW2011_GWF2_39_15]|uniref:Glycosyltransferase RgtA/B/C/D-like domain-containing protein n=1 Tax=candidate division WS6 bacterium GW2011_GWF2_39_15 TaxID=1619100 RepID=A0A0G0MYW9_9BACT|nr:MAG: hypothetical protein UT34_C0002G0258 [candidate division WS6 bacterium GW2011_GWF2_39_15]